MEERTQEIAIEYLEHYKKVKYGMMPEWVWDMAIKALEQEPILDKIRAEIEHLTITEGGEDYTRKMAELYSLKVKVLQIIDKYKEESEE